MESSAGYSTPRSAENPDNKTMKTSDDFYREILALQKESAALKGELAGRVMPVLQLYKSLQSYEERRVFQDALEKMLTSDQVAIRKLGVDICLGFFVFRDAV